MLTNKQFAALSKIDAPLTGEMEEFAMFSLDLGDAKAEVGRTPDGTRIVKHLCPSLRGKGVNLWEGTPRGGEAVPPAVVVSAAMTISRGLLTPHNECPFPGG